MRTVGESGLGSEQGGVKKRSVQLAADDVHVEYVDALALGDAQVRQLHDLGAKHFPASEMERKIEAMMRTW